VVKLEHERNNFGGIWHSGHDVSPVPPMGQHAAGLEIPPYGGRHDVRNQYLAYESLSDGLEERRWTG